MKVLKIVAIAVVAVVVIFLVIALLAPKDYKVSRSTTIDAPAEIVHDQVTLFRNFQEWQPWGDMDPDMKVTIEGEDGTVGAVYRWEGNEDVGIGSQEITHLTSDRMDVTLRFEEPWQSEDHTWFVFEKTAEGTEVTWAMEGSNPFPMNGLMWLMNMEKMIGNDYEKGLSRLKERCESLAASTTFRGYRIDMMDVEPLHYVAMRGTVPWQELPDYYATHFKAISGAIAAAGLSPAGPMAGLYYTWDDENQTADLAAGIPVDQMVEIEGYQSITVGGKALHVAYYGPYEGVEAPHMAMDDYMKAHNIGLKEPVVEAYVTDPMREPDTSKWRTDIYYFVD